MNWKRKVTQTGPYLLATLLAIYVVAYLLLRISGGLVTRSYLVYHANEFGDETTIEHMDIGRGSAFTPQGKLRPPTGLAAVFSALSWIELHARGYGDYPVASPSPEIGMGEDVHRIKVELEANPPNYLPDSPDHRQWKTNQSYYALLNIINTHLTNRHNTNLATKRDVLLHLGEPNWGFPRQEPSKEWAYQGFGRREPNRDKVIFTFNSTDELTAIGWVSE